MLIPEAWGLHPGQDWLRGQDPEKAVEFDEEKKYWHVHRHADVVTVLSDHERFSAEIGRIIPDYPTDSFDGDLTQMDPPKHRQLRAIASRAFTPKVVADLEPRIHRITEELLDGVSGRDGFEFVETLAHPLPVIVIADLLGVPKSDLGLFRAWTDMAVDPPVEFSLDEETLQQYSDGYQDMNGQVVDYLREHAADRRVNPREDLLTRLVQAEVDGQGLNEVQLANFVMLLFVAGHITTTMLLGNTILCLDAHPEEFARVRSDRSLVPAAIEEALRVLSPITHMVRVTTVDVELGGVTVPKDSMVALWLSAAGRDPRQFADPHRYDPLRDPNAHLAFGRGIHFCLGAPLARLEGRVALNILLDRFPKLRVDPDSVPVFKPNPAFTRLSALNLLTG
ncbi:cytochrome P450 [Phytomonospora sp. NPDC050363]|uniref:cytochrome P450 n=1 Tax=Phytomonospora sp. NPDC050363 TaxID=3155642 RepID=UPI0033CA1E32